MKRMQITINADGTSDIDLQEGFSGMSCIEKSKEIEQLEGMGTTIEVALVHNNRVYIGTNAKATMGAGKVGFGSNPASLPASLTP